MTQFARPDSDISTGSWGTTPLWSKLDEVSASDADLVSYYTGENSTFEVGLSNVTDPNSASSHTIRARVRYGGTEAPDQIIVELKEGTTVRATFNITPSTSFVTYSYTLSSAEANAIGDYTNLRLAVTGDVAGLGADTEFLCSWLVFEVPDALTPVSNTGAPFFESLQPVSQSA